MNTCNTEAVYTDGLQPVTVYGWTFKQWASAAAIMGRSPDTRDGALDLRREWMCKWTEEPSEDPIIIGVDRPMDYIAAKKVFQVVMA